MIVNCDVKPTLSCARTVVGVLSRAMASAYQSLLLNVVMNCGDYESLHRTDVVARGTWLDKVYKKPNPARSD